MTLHPVLREKLEAGLEPVALQRVTRREVRLPVVPNKVHTVLGMRRVGKTTFLRQVQQDQQATLGPERAVYVGFDDDRLADLPLGQLDALLEEYYRTVPQFRARHTVWWLFDEIQVVAGWERFVRRIMDSERVQVVVSGSSARLLSREVHTSLRADLRTHLTLWVRDGIWGACGYVVASSLQRCWPGSKRRWRRSRPCPGARCPGASASGWSGERPTANSRR